MHRVDSLMVGFVPGLRTDANAPANVIFMLSGRYHGDKLGMISLVRLHGWTLTCPITVM